MRPRPRAQTVGRQANEASKMTLPQPVSSIEDTRKSTHEKTIRRQVFPQAPSPAEGDKPSVFAQERHRRCGCEKGESRKRSPP